MPRTRLHFDSCRCGRWRPLAQPRSLLLFPRLTPCTVSRIIHVGHSLLDSKRPTLLNIRPLDPATIVQPPSDAHSNDDIRPAKRKHAALNPSPVRLAASWKPAETLRLLPWTRIDARNPPGAQGHAMFSKNFSRETSSSKADETFWKTPEDDLSSRSSFAFHPCAPAGARASAAPQGGRPKGQTAGNQGGQSCSNSSRRPSRCVLSIAHRRRHGG